jgi:hypothetical protein
VALKVIVRVRVDQHASLHDLVAEIDPTAKFRSSINNHFVPGHRLRFDSGKVTKDMMQSWLTRANVELRGAGLDESPDCYKRLSDVLAEHGDSIRILHTLTPVGVAMAGVNQLDPYKD